MSRGLATAFKTALGGTVVYPSLFVDFEFDSATSRFWTGVGNISWNSNTYVGGALLGGISFAGESEDISARQMTFTLNGVDPTYYATAIATKYRGRPVKVWFNLLDTVPAVQYSYLVEEGRMDTLNIDESGDTISLTLTAESRLIEMFKANRLFLNSSDHKKVYPSDDFYKFVPSLPNSRFPWGLDSGLKRVSAGGLAGWRTGQWEWQMGNPGGTQTSGGGSWVDKIVNTGSGG